jgi:hypothetical protein
MGTHLVTELVLDVLLDTTEHERLEDHVKSPQLMLVHRSLVLGVALDVLGEPLAELVVRVEEGRHDEVEEGPEFVHRVLDGGTGEEESVAAAEAEERLPSCTSRALDRLGFVEDHVLPLDSLEVLLILHDLRQWMRSALLTRGT